MEIPRKIELIAAGIGILALGSLAIGATEAAAQARGPNAVYIPEDTQHPHQAPDRYKKKLPVPKNGGFKPTLRK